MAIYDKDGNRITNVTVQSGTKINFVKNKAGTIVWVRAMEVIFKLPWAKLLTWSIKRISAADDAAIEDVASNSTNTGLTDDAELKVSGYYGDTYQLVHKAPAGYSGLIATNTTFSLDADDYTNNTKTFRDTGGTIIKLQAPVVTVSREGAKVIAKITNPNSITCHLSTTCEESEYKVVTESWLGDSTEYKHGHLYYTGAQTTKKGIESGKTFTATWTSNESGHDCNYAVVSAYFYGLEDTVYAKSDTTRVSNGTEQLSNSGSSGHSGPAFIGFGGTLAS